MFSNENTEGVTPRPQSQSLQSSSTSSPSRPSMQNEEQSGPRKGIVISLSDPTKNALPKEAFIKSEPDTASGTHSRNHSGNSSGSNNSNFNNNFNNHSNNNNSSRDNQQSENGYDLEQNFGSVIKQEQNTQEAFQLLQQVQNQGRNQRGDEDYSSSRAPFDGDRAFGDTDTDRLQRRESLPDQNLVLQQVVNQNQQARETQITPRLPDPRLGTPGFVFTDRVNTNLSLLPIGSRLFVGRLPRERCTKTDVFEFFGRYGEIIEISLKGAFGFVQYTNIENCKRAILSEQHSLFMGSYLNLDICDDQPKYIVLEESEQARQKEHHMRIAQNRGSGFGKAAFRRERDGKQNDFGYGQSNQNYRDSNDNRHSRQSMDRDDNDGESKNWSAGIKRPYNDSNRDYGHESYKSRDDDHGHGSKKYESSSYDKKKNWSSHRENTRERSETPQQNEDRYGKNSKTGNSHYRDKGSDYRNRHDSRDYSPDAHNINRRYSRDDRSASPAGARNRSSMTPQGGVLPPRRYGKDVPMCQILNLETIDNQFSWRVTSAFNAANITINEATLSTYKERAMIQQYAIEGVQAIAFMNRKAVSTGKLKLHVFQPSSRVGNSSIQFDEYIVTIDDAVKVMVRHQLNLARNGIFHGNTVPPAPPAAPAMAPPPMFGMLPGANQIPPALAAILAASYGSSGASNLSASGQGMANNLFAAQFGNTNNAGAAAGTAGATPGLGEILSTLLQNDPMMRQQLMSMGLQSPSSQMPPPPPPVAPRQTQQQPLPPQAPFGQDPATWQYLLQAQQQQQLQQAQQFQQAQQHIQQLQAQQAQSQVQQQMVRPAFQLTPGMMPPQPPQLPTGFGGSGPGASPGAGNARPGGGNPPPPPPVLPFSFAPSASASYQPPSSSAAGTYGFPGSVTAYPTASSSVSTAGGSSLSAQVSIGPSTQPQQSPQHQQHQQHQQQSRQLSGTPPISSSSSSTATSTISSASTLHSPSAAMAGGGAGGNSSSSRVTDILQQLERLRKQGEKSQGNINGSGGAGGPRGSPQSQQQQFNSGGYGPN